MTLNFHCYMKFDCRNNSFDLISDYFFTAKWTNHAQRIPSSFTAKLIKGEVQFQCNSFVILCDVPSFLLTLMQFVNDARRTAVGCSMLIYSFFQCYTKNSYTQC